MEPESLVEDVMWFFPAVTVIDHPLLLFPHYRAGVGGCSAFWPRCFVGPCSPALVDWPSLLPACLVCARGGRVRSLWVCG